MPRKIASPPGLTPAKTPAEELATRRKLAQGYAVNGGPPKPPPFKIGAPPLPSARPYRDELDGSAK